MVVLLSALVIAFESVAIEASINIADLSSLIVSTIPMLVGGSILMGASANQTTKFARSLDFKGWLWMFVLCALVAGGVILWFDAVGRIGASKEAILGGGSSEVLFVVILSVLFLRERLNKVEGVGSCFIVMGVFLVLFDEEVLSLSIGVGEAEAIMSSVLLAASVVVTALLLKNHELTPLSGVELFLSGILLLVAGVLLRLISWPDLTGWLILIGLGVFPAIGLLTYNAGLPKIGASLTSVLFALVGIMTVGVQLVVLAFSPHAELKLPDNLVLAIIGGVVAFAGVYLLNMNPGRKMTANHEGAEGEI